MKTVLVTGGAGYIGSHTCKKLYKTGYKPIVFDNLSTGHKKFVKWGELVVGDLHNTSLLLDTFEKYNPSAVIHFAASAYVGESITDPFKYYRNNVGGSLSLFEAMRSSKVRNIVFSSTCATYGVPNLDKIDELVPQEPINPYGSSKLMIERILRDLSIRDEIKSISLRYFNAAGADRDCEIGELHDPETHLIPLAIQSAFNGSRLKVLGTDFPTKDGSAVRDYIHVEDLADAHIKALKYLLNGGDSDSINLGTGTGTSVFEIIAALKEIGVEVVYDESNRRIGDPAYLVADSSRAKLILNWESKYSDIKDILKTALLWHRKNDKFNSKE